MWLVDNEKTVQGKTVLICSDIDMSGVDWLPIYSEGEIGYTIDGQGHTLRNFSIDEVRVVDHTIGSGFLSIKVNAFIGVWAKFTGLMKNLSFENIVINGLADADFPNNDDGTNHKNESAYFAGCIGYSGANYSSAGQFENVHARHVHIKASSGKITSNVGGLIGWLGEGGGSDPNWTVYLKNCSATDVHLIGFEVGGLVGAVKAGRGVGFINCQTENVYIRIRPFILKNEATSGFIGKIDNGKGVTIRDCKSPLNIELLEDSSGKPSEYQPASEFYGYVESNTGTPKIETTEP